MAFFIYIHLLLRFIVDCFFFLPSFVYNESDEGTLNLPYIVYTKEGGDKNTESNYPPSDDPPSDGDDGDDSDGDDDSGADDNPPVKVTLNDDSSGYNSDKDS